MANRVTLKASGLYTYPNNLGEVPSGALSVADNAVIDREGVIGTRRGFKIYGNTLAGPTTTRAKQLLEYKKRLLRHYSTSLEYDNGSGTFNAFSGSFSETETGLRIKSTEQNGNCYFTTSEGIKKISALTAADLATTTITNSGIPKALDVKATLNSQTGFFTQEGTVAYRIVWGIKDTNTNLILSSPSERVVLYNSLLTLLIKDFNGLLDQLDTAVNVSGADNLQGNPAGTPYLDSAISLNVTSLQLQISLAGLAGNLHADLPGNGFDTIQTAINALTIDSPATSAQLISLQVQFDEIVDKLNSRIGTADIDSAVVAFTNSTQSSTVKLEFTIPQSITTAHFYQVYRTIVTANVSPTLLSDIDPGDEMGLVLEDNPTATDITNNYITVIDITPEDFRGANLYTNPNSGEGILQANDLPPLSKDIASFKNCVFYSNTKTRHRKTLNLLAVSDLSGKTLLTGQGVTSVTYYFVQKVKQITTINSIAGSLFTASGTADYFDIYSANNIEHFRLWIDVDNGNTAPAGGTGITLVEVDVLSTDTSTMTANKISNQLRTLNAFSSSYLVNVITVTNEDAGYTTSPTENVANVGFTIVVATSGVGEDVTARKIAVSDAATPAQQVDETARSMVRVINRQTSELLYAFYLSGTNDIPGQMLLEARSLITGQFFVIGQDDVVGSKFNPDISPKHSIAIGGISVANPTSITSTAHGLVTGDQIVISYSGGSTPVFNGVYTINQTGVNTFTVPVNVTVSNTAIAWYSKISELEKSDNEESKNRLYFSKIQQPEAVPVLNYLDVGPKDEKILRIIPLRESLFILKESSTYRLSGDSPTSFSVSIFDNTTTFVTPDTAVNLDNRIFYFGDAGIVTLSDTGSAIISRQIENKLVNLTTDAYTAFPSASFGVAYHSDRSYYLWTVTNPIDTEPTQCFKYNTLTNTWTRYPISKTCGLVSTDKDLLYLGAGDTTYIEEERKSFTRLDHADRESVVQILAGGLTGLNLNLGSLMGAVKGDVLVQTQKLTIGQFNRLLKQLDDDTGVTQTDYYSTLKALPGDNLASKLQQLTAKLDTDTTDGGYSPLSTGNNTFSVLQSDFNAVVNKLNADTVVSFSNYSLSVGDTGWEVIIDNTVESSKTIVLLNTVAFIVGPCTLYKNIALQIEWVPEHFGDPQMTKHVRDSTIIFETMNFTKAIVSYASDLNRGFVPIEFNGEGTGVWGNFNWSGNTWGGEGSSRPLRTLIPRDKQRCRYISCKFQHAVALEKFALYGVTFTFEAINTIGYR